MSMHSEAAPVSDALRALSDARVRVVQQPTAARVADALREQVSEGHFRPGSRMPEEAIGQALGVSRNTVREAFVELTGERLLVREPNRGVFVAIPDAAAVIDIYRARRVLEIGAVRAGGSTAGGATAGGATAGGATAVAVARTAVNEGIAARAAGDSAGVGTANQHFHRALVGLASSTRLNRLMGQMLAEVRLVFHTGNLSPDFYLAYLDDNDALCTLLEGGLFSEAADRLDAYLRRSEDEVLQAMSTASPRGA